MAFPVDPLPVLVEMKTGTGVFPWTNITSDVLLRDGIDISRGKQSEDGQAPPQTCRLTLNNRAGKYSPRNPLGSLYGSIGRNTQLRIAIETDPVFDAYSSAQGSGNLSWTHTPVGDPTGVCLILWEWNVGGTVVDPGEVTYGGVAMERMSFLPGTVNAVSVVKHVFWLNRNIPTGPQTVFLLSDSVVSRQASVMTVRGGTNAEIDVVSAANGVGTNPFGGITISKRSLIFASLFSDLDDGSTISPGVGYTQLGEHDLGTETVAAAYTAVVQAPGTYSVSWTAATGGWSIHAVAIRAVHYRFTGEVSSFPPKWDTSANDAYVPIDAAGILRRLSQGTDPAETSLRGFVYPAPSLYRYWPLSSAKGTRYSVDVAPQTSYPRGYKLYAEHATGTGNFVYGTDMGNEYLGPGMAFFNSIAGPMRADVGLVAPYWAFDFVFSTIVNTNGMGNFTARFPSYDGAQWSVNFYGGIATVSFDDGLTGPIAFSPTAVLQVLQDLDPHHVRFKLLKNGANTDWTLYIDGAVVDSGTQAAYVSAGLQMVRFFIVRAAGEERINLAHLAFFADAGVESWPTAAAMYEAMTGYAGEAAGTRMVRVSSLAGIPLTSVGDMANTIQMGPQHSESAMTTLRDAESTDLGILSETRDASSLLYRTRASLYNQTVKATISAAALELAPPFEPVDDDQTTRNIITAVRRDGDSFRLEDTTSRLSSLDPPLGVGPYKDEVTFNVETEGQLPAMASWLMHLGTVDEARYPTITMDRSNRAVVANATLSAALLQVDIGDRMAITNIAVARIYDDISLLVLGYSERMGAYDHTITFNCAPESPYNVAVYGSAVGSGPDRYDTAGSTLTAGVTSTATSLSVTTATGNVVWTTVAAEFPFDIVVAGERMTVTNITSATSPQTFTVTRSINGVVKAQSAAAAVRLWNTPRYAL